jgi:TrmH family RNA methyltransferase
MPDKHYLVSSKELQKISALKTANAAVALFEIPKLAPIRQEGIIVVLDAVRDPGNLGTIIRLCDWFGVQVLICSPDTADCYNPKVIQATMGSIARVSVHYTDLIPFLKTSELPVYGAVMKGLNVYREQLPNEAILVMGNEANGISSEIETYISKRVTIPGFGDTKTAESLNVATATAVLLSEFRRTTET